MSSALVCAVDGFRPADDEALGQLRLQRPGDRGHAGEIGHALVVDPVPELLGAERRLADRGSSAAQFRARQADQVAPTVRQPRRRRIEQRRLGQDARAFGGEEKVARGIIHDIIHGQAFAIAL